MIRSFDCKTLILDSNDHLRLQSSLYCSTHSNPQTSSSTSTAAAAAAAAHRTT